MEASTYYRDHWLEIEPERLAAYDEMFQWRPEMEPLLEPAELAAGQTVVDYGCGPGSLVVELARRVGPAGHVHGVDLNDDFLERSRRRVAEEGLSERVSLHRIEQDHVPLEDGTADRVVCKNVLEYVHDVVTTLSDFRRVLRPAGLAHLVDSDWGLLTVEPIGPERLARLFAAASAAYRTPLIGRKLYGLARQAGFAEVKVRVLAGADTRGYLLPVLRNMGRYAVAAGGIEADEVEAIVADAEAAVDAGTYLAVLPQFLVTGRSGG